MTKEALKALIEKLNEKYPVGIPRQEIGIATGGVLHPRTCANEDSLRIGIEGRFKIGRKTVYPVDGVIQKLKSKMNSAA